MALSAEERLSRAAEHTFLLSCEDSGAALCRANFTFGIAKLQFVQELLGYPPDATFLGAPDATVTRNDGRWNQGFGYGGRIDYTGTFATLDVKPNACGMLVAALPEHPDLQELQRRLTSLRDTAMEVAGVPLEYDLANGNHFVDVLEVDGDDTVRERYGPYVLILHGSGREMRGPTSRGLGMYWDDSEPLRNAARVIDTPFGILRILSGATATEWWEFVAWVDRFHRERRLRQADHLFGEGRYRTLVNGTHQGLVSPFEGAPPTSALLGAHVFGGAEDNLYPLTLRPDLPAYLIRGLPNLSERVLDRLGFAERAERFGLRSRLERANLLPHGGGYTYPQYAGHVRVEGQRDGERRFILGNAAGTRSVQTPRELEPSFRGQEVLDRVLELELAEVVAKLQPIFVGRT